jgi:diguanylate cyclase (GGDEF)-like protein
MMIDIDYFKQYNDLNGHIAGDVALREMAAILRRSVKREDVVARYGGEEFAVVLWNTDKSLGTVVAERLRREVQAVEFPNEQVLPAGDLTVSIGLAGFPSDSQDRAGLIARADQALYAAKRTGRNRVCTRHDEASEVAMAPTFGTPVTWRLLNGAHGGDSQAVMREMTGQGAIVMADRLPDAGAEIALQAAGAAAMAGLPSLSGKVVWKEAVPGGRQVAGVRFTEALPFAGAASQIGGSSRRDGQVRGQGETYAR